MYKSTVRLGKSITALCCFACIAASAGDKIEVTAEHIESKAGVLYAKDGVVVFYGDNVIRANTASYDKARHKLVLDGKVEMMGYRGTKERAPHLEIDTLTNEVSFKELFFANENDIWLLTRNANRRDGNYTFGSSVLSSCEIDDPIWTLHFSSASYDSAEKYMKVYNARVNLWGIPVFYTPYMAFSTDNRRSSGLLFPKVGYTEEDGFIYEQPIYWAIADNMDLELDPQIRVDRSLGMYGTFRFVDSDHSYGYLRAGYFKDKESFRDAHNLPHDTHYGLQFKYDSAKVISDALGSDYDDGLYVRISYLNDIDYLNLQKTHLDEFGQSPLQESRIDYYLQNDSWYAALNAKYYIDTRLPNNDATLQTLPALQWHKFLDSIVVNNLTYTVDVQAHHQYRKEGSRMKDLELRVPITFDMPLLDDYMHVAFKESLFAGKYYFDNGDDLVYDDLTYAYNVHEIKLYSDLTKRFDRYTHVIQPSVGYLLPGSEHHDPVTPEALLSTQPDVKDLFSAGFPEESFYLGFNQYLYDEKTDLIFFQRLTQRYYTDRDYKWSDLQNEMEYDWNDWRFYNNLVYSFEFGAVRESASYIGVQKENYSFGVGHTFKQALTESKKKTKANNLNIDLAYDLNDHVSLYGRWRYDLEKTELQLWRFGGSYHQDCWSVAASVSADVRPKPTSVAGVLDYDQEYSFYVQLNFIPFASINTATLSGENAYRSY